MNASWVLKEVDQARGVVITWFSVLTRGPHAFEQIDLERPSTLFYALKFALCMTLVNFLVSMPALPKLDLKNVALIEPFWMSETFVEYLAFGPIFYGCMKLFGGKGSLQASTTAYCLLTAYLPIVSVLMLPVHMFLLPHMAEAMKPGFLAALRDNSLQLSPSDLFGLLLSFVISTFVLVVFYTAVFRTFRMIHKLSTARTVAAFVPALLGQVLFSKFFLMPWLARISALAKAA